MRMRKYVLAIIIAGICFPTISFSQEMKPDKGDTQSEDVTSPTSQQLESDTVQKIPKNGFKILFSCAFGSGGEKQIVGETTEGDEICIRTGGGIGVAITLGYNFFNKVDLDLSAGYQLNSLKPQCDNLDGYFSRVPLLITAKYWIPTKNNAFFKLGGGLGYYTSVEYDMDGSESFAMHEIIEYDNAPGFHIVGEYELFSPVKPFSFIMGVKYSHVSYTANSFTVNGTSHLISELPSNLKTLKGSSFDIYFGFGWYF